LKETDTTYWNPPNTDATNEIGFTVLPGVGRDYLGWFDILNPMGITGYWLSSTEDLSTSAFHWGMQNTSSYVGREGYNKKNGFSVRCIKA